MSRPRTVDNGLVLEFLLEKYANEKEILYCVYKLSYAGKYIIVKTQNFTGSLYAIQKAFSWYAPEKVKDDNIYKFFYDYILKNPWGRFRVKILLQSIRPYFLLKREQIELDKGRYDPDCLNNQIEAYIPKYNPFKEAYGQAYGWISKTDVLLFQKYLKSSQRKYNLTRYKMLQQPKPAKNVKSNRKGSFSQV